MVTTELRNQRGGFVTILDPQLFTILDIAEIPEPDGFLTPLGAWPESGQIWAGQLRQLDDLYETFGRHGVDCAISSTENSLVRIRWNLAQQ